MRTPQDNFEVVHPDFWDVARAACRHEIGHLVVARLAGFKTGAVKVEVVADASRYQASATIVPTESLHSLRDVGSYLRRRIVSLLSGVAAETLDPRGKVKLAAAHSLLSSTAVSDNEKAVELATILYGLENAGGFGPQTSAALTRPLELRDKLLLVAADLVEAHLQRIHSLSDELLSKVKPGEVACLDALQLQAHPLVTSLAPIEI